MLFFKDFKDPENYIFALFPSISDISFSEQFFNTVVALATHRKGIQDIGLYIHRNISRILSETLNISRILLGKFKYRI